jgi:hypothetical protein
MRGKICIVLFILIIGGLLLPYSAFSAWTQPKGHSYHQLTVSYYITNQKFQSMKKDETGAVIDPNSGIHKYPAPEFTSTKITYYGEYGIIDKLTVYTSIPYDWQESEDTKRYAGENGPSGIGDINLGLRYNITQALLGSKWLMSVQGELKIPEAYDYGHPLRELSLGSGQYDLTLTAMLGRAFDWGYAWANLGYKFRFENDKYDPITFDPSDQVKISFGGGYQVTSRFSIRGSVDISKSVGNASVSKELIRENYKYGGIAEYGDTVIIKDTLGLEPDVVNVGVSFVYNITKQCWPKCVQVVLSYNKDIEGLGPFRTKDYSEGHTFSAAVAVMF